ncbi:MAG: peptide-methionine (S)-S-oxide reductase MsrA [Chitinophagales bacterium]|nr:peptide-methionine (S)-S-oxide reductase MsrA [Chitinophagales bacterium]
MTTAEKTDRAIFASGCFWGTEYYFQKVKGVIKTTVGFTGGNKENATYRDVCSGITGHAEAVEVTFDPSLTSYEELTKLFFETHNPAQKNRQGPDIGSQYRSAVFYKDDEQKEVTERLIQTLREKGHEVVTEVAKAGDFWVAEDKHQQYYTKGGGNPYCHSYTKKF